MRSRALKKADWQAEIERQLRGEFGVAGELSVAGRVGGGDIHQAFTGRFGSRKLFIKFNARHALPQFEAERRGLEALARSDGPRVPQVLCCGGGAGGAWLVLEHLELHAAGDAAALGRQLAAQHRCEGPAHGWPEDNFLGATPQPNGWLNDWTEFFRQRRLGHQATLARRAGHDPRLLAGLERLQARLPRLLEGHRPVPSLLHGDLWGGNHGYGPQGEPVIFDPACHHGDRETDLAMMTLFGGFDARVFAAYHESWPLPEGHERRRPLYQLYHVLNHLELFGAGWLPRARALLDLLLAG